MRSNALVTSPLHTALLAGALLCSATPAVAQEPAPATGTVKLALDLDEGSKRRFELQKVTTTKSKRGERSSVKTVDVTYEIELTVTKELEGGAYRVSATYPRIRGQATDAKGEHEFDERADAPEGHKRSRRTEVALIGATVTFALAADGSVSDVRGLDAPLKKALRLKPAQAKTDKAMYERHLQDLFMRLPGEPVGSEGPAWQVTTPFSVGFFTAPITATAKLESATATEATLTAQGAPELDLSAFAAMEDESRKAFVQGLDTSGSTYSSKTVVSRDDGLPNTKSATVVFSMKQQRGGKEMKTVMTEKTTLSRAKDEAGR